MTAKSKEGIEDSFSFQRMKGIFEYELRWDLRKKKVLFAISFVLIIVTIIGVFFKYFFTGGNPSNSDFEWSNIIIILTNGFISGLFPLIIGGAISVDSVAWEIDKGTIIPLLSQPVKRSEIYFGKIVEKFLIILLLSLLLVFLSLVLSIITVGRQEYLIWLVPVALAFLLETMVFVSLTFMLGALIKQSGFMMLMLTGIYLSILIGSVLLMLKQGFHLWMTLIPLDGVNNLMISIQQFFLRPNGTIFVNYNLGSEFSRGTWVNVSQLLLYSILGSILSVIIFIIIGYVAFYRFEVKG